MGIDSRAQSEFVSSFLNFRSGKNIASKKVKIGRDNFYLKNI